MHEVKLNKIL